MDQYPNPRFGYMYRRGYDISRDDAAAIELGHRARNELQAESTIATGALLRERFRGARFSFDVSTTWETKRC